MPRQYSKKSPVPNNVPRGASLGNFKTKFASPSKLSSGSSYAKKALGGAEDPSSYADFGFADMGTPPLVPRSPKIK